MMLRDVLLSGVAIVASLLFIVGSFQAFRAPRGASRRGRRKPVPSGLAAALDGLRIAARRVESLAERIEALTPLATATPQALVQPRPVGGLPSRPMPGAAAEPSAPGETAGASDEDSFPFDQSERSKLVVHYADGRVIKGCSYDFYPHKFHFHLLPPVAGFSFTDEATEVRIKDLKAVFFVRDFVGDPSYNERKCFAEGERPPGRKVKVTFRDGEVLVGSTVGYDRRRLGFFLIPADPKSNNLRVFVVNSAVTNVRFL